SNDLFGRANQRAVGLIGRGAPRNSPFGRAQRDRTINISNWFFPDFRAILLHFQKNKKKKLDHEIKHK
ncbi:MAG: hypothetical protein KKF02_13465, partial [Proteobacteria bacterium]|nr:hypothetical protein [Pseudomonadota bacterium]